MKRKYLAAAVAIAPLAAVFATMAHGATQITTATTTPVATATVKNGAPDDIDITATGSVKPTASGAAVTLNSNNTVQNEGTIGFTGVDNAVGILVQGGNTGQVTNTGTISVTDTYTPTLDPKTGIPTGAFATGVNRIGIEVTGAAPFVGGITDTGVITVHGNDSQGIQIQAPITGDLLMLTVTPGVGTALPAVAKGSIAVVGDHTVGIQVAPSGGVGGNVKIVGVNASGVGARGVVIDGAVGGVVDISGLVTATGYRSTARPSNPALSTLLRADQLQQGGPAVSIGASLGGGLIVSAPPSPLVTATPDLDGNGVPDLQQGSGAISVFGAAPALRIGAQGASIVLGPVINPIVNPGGYGLVIQGSVAASGLYDQVTSPNLPAAVSATAIQIGGLGAGLTTIAGGIHNTGVVSAQAYQANATGLHIGAGAVIPTILNDGTLLASTTQVNTATTGVTPLNVTTILIDPGASVGSIVNTSAIVANITGTGGVGGAAGAIVDKSGSVTSIANTGSISAQLTQTLVSTPLPGVTTAIDLSAGTAPQTITQSVSAAFVGVPAYSATTAYASGDTVVLDGIVFKAATAVKAGQDPVNFPSLWRQIGTTRPAINGSIFFGGGGSTLNVTGGTVAGAVIDMGAGVNTLTVNGPVGTSVTGALKDEGGQLTLNVLSGTFSDTNASPIHVRAVNVGATGILLVAADPANNTNTDFIASGASSFAQGAEVGLTLKSVQIAPSRTYTILETVPGQGTLSAGTFPTGLLNNAPFLYAATAVFAPAANPATDPSEILLTVRRKTSAELGFNAAEASALDAVLTALPKDGNIQSSVLAQTTQVGLRSVYDQLLPSQGQGLFDALDAASQAVANLTGTPPDVGKRVAGSSLWLQEVNERVKRSGLDTQGSSSKLLGVIAGYEGLGLGGGAMGLTAAYFNIQEEDAGSPVGGHVAASLIEGGAYYRRSVAGLTISARGAGGYSFFSGERRFVTTAASNTAFSNWNGYFLDAHGGVAYERRFGRFYARPELSVDYLRLHESGRQDRGGGDGFDLTVGPRNSSRLSGQAIVVVGRQWGTTSWFRTEFFGGYREVFSGGVGDTLANFSGGDPFLLAPDRGKGGWATFGFSLKGGSAYSYLALEGGADLRSGEHRYDLRIAGRSLF